VEAEVDVKDQGSLSAQRTPDPSHIPSLSTLNERRSVESKEHSLPDRFTHPSRVGIGDIGESERSSLDDWLLAAGHV